MISLGELSGLIILFAGVPYLYEVFFKSVKPERSTWFVWTVILVISFFSQKSAGAHESLWLGLGDIIACGTIFIVSIFKGVGGFSRFDKICLGLAAIGVVIWQVSGIAVIAIAASLFADFMGTLPTIKKAYLDPASEGFSVFALSALAAVLSIIAANTGDAVILVAPVYIALSNLSILAARTLGVVNRKEKAA